MSRCTATDDSCLSRFPDFDSNFSVCPVVHPHFLGRYFNACNKIYNQNRIHQSDLVLDKYLLTQSGYFKLVTTVALGMGIIDGKLLYCYGFSEVNMDRKIQHWSTRTGRFMTVSIIPSQMTLVDHI